MSLEALARQVEEQQGALTQLARKVDAQDAEIQALQKEQRRAQRAQQDLENELFQLKEAELEDIRRQIGHLETEISFLSHLQPYSW